MAKWLEFEERTPPGLKTKVWKLVGLRRGDFVGWIKWSSGWRRYCFFPARLTIFDPDCLRVLADFCEQQTAEHHAQRQNPGA